MCAVGGANSMAEPVIHVSCITHLYPDETKVSICGLDFHVHKGEKVAVLGPSGAGKSTLLKHILGILVPTEGTVEVFGVDPAKHFDEIGKKIGMVMQDVEEQIIGPTVFDDLQFAPLNFGYSKQEAKELADLILKRFRIEHLKNKLPQYLSGGEKRKVTLASALVLSPEIIILDEPFAGLDPLTTDFYIDILNEENKKRQATIITTLHDVDIVPRIADTLYLMKLGGKLSNKGTPGEIFSKPGLLSEFNLRPPILSETFSGFVSPVPLTVPSARELLGRLNKRPSKESFGQ